MLFLGVGVAILDLEVGKGVMLITVIGVLTCLVQLVLRSQVGKLDSLILLEIELSGFLGVFFALEGFFLQILGDFFNVNLAVIRGLGLLAALTTTRDKRQGAGHANDVNK